MIPTVLLFDIDGTLVTTGGVGRRALERAFGAIYGHSEALDNVSLDGMTDRAITRAGLRAISVEPTDETIDDFLSRYVAYLELEVNTVDDSKFRIHRGMVQAIEAGLARGMAVGLGTGNIREGARVKLERVGLYQRFSFGGFGDDHELRAELIRAGTERGVRQLGVERAAARIVVIGDTPKDVAAAQAVGAECVAVATGVWTVEKLLERGATAAFEDLSAPGARAAVLGTSQPS
jgi:phosphoglycolate phosphatase